MKASIFNEFRNRLGKSIPQLASSLDITEELADRYENGETAITEAHEAKLYRLISRCLSARAEKVGIKQSPRENR